MTSAPAVEDAGWVAGVHYDKCSVQTIRVDTASAKYEVVAGSGLIETLAPRIERVAGRLPRRVFVVTSPEIWSLWGETFAGSFAEAPITLFLAPGEKHKTLASVEKLLRQMAAAGGDRGSLLIAFGGGIVGDVGGFVAASYMRGVKYVQVPTTFLAQVDSSVGGKTGVNLPEGKNLVGAFHHPLAVFADIGVLGTLPDRELRAGLMESVKAGIIRDRALVRFMEENSGAILKREPRALEKVIAASIRMKADVVNKDERENGLRMILNLGHTLGHAIEQVTRYKVLLHGEAVGWGMVAALYIGHRRGTISSKQAERLENLIYLYGPLPTLKLRAAKLVAATGADKKNVGGVRRFVLPVGIGGAGVVEDVTAAELEAAARFMLSRAAERQA
ncbi:MAG TPA: 3-dehydroquinate synthase [Terracidiphilus sp.]|jgi:3-dehydroquinate synthase